MLPRPRASPTSPQPVRPEVAEESQLNILAAGALAALATIRPLSLALGKRVWNLGPVPRCANAAKMVANTMLTMAIKAKSEATVLVEDCGLPHKAFFALILNTLLAGRSYQNSSAKNAGGDDEMASKRDWG